MEKHRSNCLLCGYPLVYHLEPTRLTCELCNDQFDSEAACQQGHFICNSCHSASANDLIEKVCLHTTSTKPVELANSLMLTPSISMHGPEHHFLVPAVLLTAYYNQEGNPHEKEKKLKIARQRADNVLGVGTGIFISLITNSSPLSKETWGLANQMTAESLRCIGALGGPRCCKRDTYLALKTAKKFVRQKFQITLDVADTIICQFNEFNQECLEEKCPFHTKEEI
jgi:uncharacterized protein DUF5714